MIIKPTRPLTIYEFDGKYYYQNGSLWEELPTASSQNPPNGVFVQTENGAIVTNTTDKESILGTGLGTLTIPANNFNVGDSFHLKMGGTITCLQNETIDFHIETTAGAILIETEPIELSATTNKGWELEIDFTIRQIGAAGVAQIQSNGQFVYNKNSNNIYEGATFNSLNDTTFNTEEDETLEIDVQWGSASESNSIQSTFVVLHRTYYTV
jgi:hypothetical protein